ncbi:MAG: uroporphyrinogen-III synthase [Bacteroidales bacterium]|nr:uroporphyrinogen-III synthase [Bacteroidales bacterium]
MKVKSILISQPAPADLEKSPYTRLVEKYNLEIDYKKFIKVEGVGSKEFRESKISLPDFSAVIFTSKQSVDHYFRIAKELRYNVPESMKYFCLNEATAFYLQNYVQFRKRKIFNGNQNFDELLDLMKRYKNEKFIYPCSDGHKPEIPNKLSDQDFDYKSAILYRTIAADLSHLDIEKYEMLVFFSPAGVQSLFDNFPTYVQGERAIATFGDTTANAAKELGLDVTIEAPSKEFPSMSMAIDDFIYEQRKRKR